MDKEEYYIIIKGSIHWEDHHTHKKGKYVSNACRYERETDVAILIVWGYNTIILAIDRTARQVISKDIEDFNTVNQKNLIGIWRTLHLTTTEYTFFSSTHGTLTKITIFWVIKN